MAAIAAIFSAFIARQAALYTQKVEHSSHVVKLELSLNTVLSETTVVSKMIVEHLDKHSPFIFKGVKTLYGSLTPLSALEVKRLEQLNKDMVETHQKALAHLENDSKLEEMTTVDLQTLRAEFQNRLPHINRVKLEMEGLSKVL